MPHFIVKRVPPETDACEIAAGGRKKRIYRPGSKKSRKAAWNFGGDVGFGGALEVSVGYSPPSAMAHNFQQAAQTHALPRLGV